PVPPPPPPEDDETLPPKPSKSMQTAARETPSQGSLDRRAARGLRGEASGEASGEMSGDWVNITRQFSVTSGPCKRAP
ncbi:MAG: hypothetical protein WB817_00345, partial [Terriglobales bacterium]